MEWISVWVIRTKNKFNEFDQNEIISAETRTETQEMKANTPAEVLADNIRKQNYREEKAELCLQFLSFRVRESLYYSSQASTKAKRSFQLKRYFWEISRRHSLTQMNIPNR